MSKTLVIVESPTKAKTISKFLGKEYEITASYGHVRDLPEDKLPRMARAVFRNDAAHLRHQMELSSWQLDITVPADAFTPNNAGSANPIPFAHPHPKPATGTKPPG